MHPKDFQGTISLRRKKSRRLLKVLLGIWIINLFIFVGAVCAYIILTFCIGEIDEHYKQIPIFISIFLLIIEFIVLALLGFCEDRILNIVFKRYLWLLAATLLFGAFGFLILVFQEDGGGAGYGILLLINCLD